MSQVKLRRTKEGVTGKMGLSWIGHCMEHFGLEEMVNEVYGDKKKSNREIGAYEKDYGRSNDKDSRRRQDRRYRDVKSG